MDIQQVAIPVARYRFRFRALSRIALPPFSGSTWRGVFGMALKDSVCVTRQATCHRCLLVRHCSYSYLFETPPPPDTEKMRRYNAAPHPFLIEPHSDVEIRANESFGVDAVLIGKGNDYLPFVVHALRAAGEQGIGRANGRFVLESLALEAGSRWREFYAPGDALEIPDPTLIEAAECPQRVRVVLQTPLRLQRQGRLLDAERFEFPAFFSSILRRLSMLRYFHTDTPLEVDFKGLTRAASGISPTARDLRWFDWNRYSNRQKRALEMGGLLGSFVLEGPGLEPYWPYLVAGEQIHTGKGTVMGLGRYHLEVMA
ncbi:MAG: CRISPR system precrRNA processing endoribonuclease RAMP protein Cas6 [Gammaproteobacteria bacterium]|nr:CRISPR system precrRNA processing endoribonuclease RAMP protein Cas6 [Gammaproteobacteria bacterium]